MNNRNLILQLLIIIGMIFFIISIPDYFEEIRIVLVLIPFVVAINIIFND